MSNSHSGTIGRTRGLSINGQVRRQRSIEWQKERRYSSSEEDVATSATSGGQPSRRNNFPMDCPTADSSILAQLIAQTQQLTSKCKLYFFPHIKLFRNHSFHHDDYSHFSYECVWMHVKAESDKVSRGTKYFLAGSN